VGQLHRQRGGLARVALLELGADRPHQRHLALDPGQPLAELRFVGARLRHGGELLLGPFERGGGLGEALGGLLQLVRLDQGFDRLQQAVGGLLVRLADRFDRGFVFLAGGFGGERRGDEQHRGEGGCQRGFADQGLPPAVVIGSGR
jgi:hypothetical protein